MTNNAIFKNDLLSSMIMKLSEQAKSNVPQEEKKIISHNITKEKPRPYENFTEELMKEQYPRYFQSNFLTPNEFTLTNQGKDDNSKAINKINSLIDKYNAKKKEEFQLKSFNLFKWLKAYSLLTNTEVQNIELALSKLKNYTYTSPSTLCEVKSITIIDCIQVISVVDVTLKRKNLILYKNEYKQNSNENLNSIINDYFLKVGDLFLCRLNGREEPEKDYIKVNIREIEKLN